MLARSGRILINIPFIPAIISVVALAVCIPLLLMAWTETDAASKATMPLGVSALVFLTIANIRWFYRTGDTVHCRSLLRRLDIPVSACSITHRVTALSYVSTVVWNLKERAGNIIATSGFMHQLIAFRTRGRRDFPISIMASAREIERSLTDIADVLGVQALQEDTKAVHVIAAEEASSMKWQLIGAAIVIPLFLAYALYVRNR